MFAKAKRLQQIDYLERCMFKTKSIYIKISLNSIEVTDLDTGKTISRQTIKPFSAGTVVERFNNTNEIVASVFKELGVKIGLFQPRLKVLIQQLERSGG